MLVELGLKALANEISPEEISQDACVRAIYISTSGWTCNAELKRSMKETGNAQTNGLNTLVLLLLLVLTF